MLIWLIGTAGGWMLLDFAYYGNTISSPEILELIEPAVRSSTTRSSSWPSSPVRRCPATPWPSSCWTGPAENDPAPGFGMMALFLLIGLVPGVTKTVVPFVLLYGVSYFFTEFGPNTTTFIYPAEIFPVDVRTTGHGISAEAGKMGAFARAYLFPVMLASSWGIRGAEIVSGIVSVGGLGLTILSACQSRRGRPWRRSLPSSSGARAGVPGARGGAGVDMHGGAL